MEPIEARIAFIEICLGSFVGNPATESREGSLLGELATLPVEESFKKQLKSYVRMPEEKLEEKLEYYLQEKSKSSGAFVNCA
jgi:hypothetical protein